MAETDEPVKQANLPNRQETTNLRNKQWKTYTREEGMMAADVYEYGRHVLATLNVPKELGVVSVGVVGSPVGTEEMVYVDLRVRLTTDQMRALFGLSKPEKK